MPFERGADHPGPFAAMRAFAGASWAGLLLGLSAFAAGFVFGILRVVFVTPAVGSVAAVLLELTILLPLLWWGAGRICKGMKVSGRNPRFMVGLTALATLLSLETCFALAGVKLSVGAYLAGITTPTGLIGLAGQAVLAWLPAMHGAPAPRARLSPRRGHEGQNSKSRREGAWPRFQH